jgi:hypothetical protein
LDGGEEEGENCGTGEKSGWCQALVNGRLQ